MKKRAHLQWQKIASAPRDGTPILVALLEKPEPLPGLEWLYALFGEHVSIAAWTSTIPGATPGWVTLAAAMAIAIGRHGAEHHVEPTHWSHLPPPPVRAILKINSDGTQTEQGDFISTLPLSSRTRTFLIKQGCKTRADLLELKALSNAEIEKWPKVGPKTVSEIRSILDSL
jgi:hypothetical protein